MPRSIFGLTLEELQDIVNKDVLPDDITLDGMVVRPDFHKVFALRAKPSELAKYLIDGKAGVTRSTAYIPSIPTSMREEKLALKKRELELKEKKLGQSTTVLIKVEEVITTLNAMNKRMSEMEKALKRLISLHLKGEKDNE